MIQQNVYSAAFAGVLRRSINPQLETLHFHCQRQPTQVFSHLLPLNPVNQWLHQRVKPSAVKLGDLGPWWFRNRAISSPTIFSEKPGNFSGPDHQFKMQRTYSHSDVIVETSAARGYEVRNGRARTNRDLVMNLLHVTVSYEISENMFNLRSFRTVHFGLYSGFFAVAVFFTAWTSLQVEHPGSWLPHTGGHDVYPGDFHGVLSPGLDFMTANGGFSCGWWLQKWCNR